MGGQFNPQATLPPRENPTIQLNKEDGWLQDLEGKGKFFSDQQMKPVSSCALATTRETQEYYTGKTMNCL